jgi:hypothetical protein
MHCRVAEAIALSLFDVHVSSWCIITGDTLSRTRLTSVGINSHNRRRHHKRNSSRLSERSTRPSSRAARSARTATRAARAALDTSITSRGFGSGESEKRGPIGSAIRAPDATCVRGCVTMHSETWKFLPAYVAMNTQGWINKFTTSGARRGTPDGKFSPSNSLAESSSGRHYRNSILNGHDRGAELRGINERPWLVQLSAIAGRRTWLIRWPRGRQIRRESERESEHARAHARLGLYVRRFSTRVR